MSFEELFEHVVQEETTLGYAGQRDAFQITTPDGSRINGYTRNQDFADEKSSPTRGEIFYIEVPDGLRGKGVGTALAKEAIALLKDNGATTVNLSPTSDAGKALIARLIKDGEIESPPIRTSKTGKAEYNINNSQRGLDR